MHLSKLSFAAVRCVPVLLIICFFSACSHTDNIEKSPIPPTKIIDVTLSKGIRETGGSSLPVEPSDSYTTTDDAVFAHITLAHLTGTHKLRWEWVDPSGRRYHSSDITPITVRKGAYVKEGAACHALKLSESAATDLPGQWRMRLYLDDSLAAVEKFTLTPAPEDLIGEDLSGIDFGRYHALVIGNDRYRDLPKLKCAGRDAEAVGKVLSEEYNYQVTVKRDATRSDIVLALDDLRRRLTSKDNLLIYYAGHGWLDKDADGGYWLPVDAARDNSLNWIASSQITAAIKAMDAKHVLIVADSCYAGKLVRGMRDIGVKKLHGYYRSIVKRRVRSVLCSGGLEPVTDGGGDNDHSVFAAAFIEALNTRVSVGYKFRLPTESEWEYAARAENRGSRHWGDDANLACRYANVRDQSYGREHPDATALHNCDDGYAYTSPVGHFVPSEFGLFDMIGNVYEWVEDDWHNNYEYAPLNGIAWIYEPTRGTERVLRGGGSGSTLPGAAAQPVVVTTHPILGATASGSVWPSP